MIFEWTPRAPSFTYRVYDGRDPVYAGVPSFETDAEALNYIIDSKPNMIGQGDTIRYTYPSTLHATETIYLPDLGSFYEQFPWSVTVNTYNSVLFSTGNPTGRSVFLITQYAPLEGEPVTPPDDVTLQLGLINQKFHPKPSQGAILTKYSNGVGLVRAQFDGSRTAVIRAAKNGGFLLYEEVDSAPFGVMYVYNADRRLKEVISVDLLAQYIV